MEKYKYSAIETKLMEQSVVPFAIYQFIDKRVVTIVLSEGFMNLFGLSDRNAAYQLMDNDMYRDTHPDDVARIADMAVRFATNDEGYNVIYRTKKDGEYRIIHAYGEHIYPEENIRLAMVWYVDEGVYTGINLEQEDLLTQNFSASLHDSSLQRKNNYDFLTGLPNMTYFFELSRTRRSEAQEANQHCAICYANLNGMKHYNRKYGFAEGDELLRSFSNLLAAHFGYENSCRIGQDNFAFFTLLEGVEDKLKEIFDEIDKQFEERKIAVRVGIYPDTMGFVEASIACDRARYACNTLKNSKISDFRYYDDSMLIEENHRQYIIENLDRALEEGWVQAYWQPIVRTANGKVCDEEALARWIDPVKGMLSPAEFIPILEEEKLIYKVDLYMVDQIIDKMKAQRDAGLYLDRMSVNLSRTDFDCCDMVEEIRKKIDASEIGRDMLTIEITESVLGSDFDFMKKQIERFQSLGFSVWIDDFGSGYSSLDTLQNIHFDLIKLDMRFMKQFDNESSKIIIAEIMKMAMGLGIETIMEGVEREDQIDFLREVGCTKLQGYYFCKPIPFEEIVERNKKGIQIGFENPEESDYYESLGRINLYDLSVVASEDEMFDNYFNTLPMSISESDDTTLMITRCNHSYREFMKRFFGNFELNVPVSFEQLDSGPGAVFSNGIKKCAQEGNRIFIDDKMGEDTTIHALIRKIATNPVTGITACAIVVLGIIQDSRKTVTYADIANSLSADYLYLYYVNIETDTFVEYRPDPFNENLTVERHGSDFFTESRKDAQTHLYKDDIEHLTSTFYKEYVIDSIDRYGKYTLVYRLMVDGEPVYVNMKAIRMSNDKKHIVVGVNNVDAQMKQREALERMKEERITYGRITALASDYLCVYTVNPVDDSFTEYGAKPDYSGLGLKSSGEDFFGSVRNSLDVIYDEDRSLLEKSFTKENVMKEIKEKGLYAINYRLMLDNLPTYVSLKAAIVEEKDGPQLIVGISNIDDQVRRII